MFFSRQPGMHWMNGVFYEMRSCTWKLTSEFRKLQCIFNDLHTCIRWILSWKILRKYGKSSTIIFVYKHIYDGVTMNSKDLENGKHWSTLLLFQMILLFGGVSRCRFLLFCIHYFGRPTVQSHKKVILIQRYTGSQAIWTHFRRLYRVSKKLVQKFECPPA